jgi:type II secretory pathway component PulF
VADFRIQFYQNFSTLLSAGLPILRTLKTLQKQSPRRYRKLLGQIETEVSQGSELSEAFAKRPRLFADLDVMLVHVGEQTGQLAEILKDMGDWYQKRQQQRRMIQSGLAYPAFILHFGAFLAPAPSAILSGGTDAYIRGVLTILALFYIPLGLFLLYRCLAPRRGILRRIIDSITLLIPLFGSAFRCLAIGRYSSVFSIMYKAGIPILRCAELAPFACGNLAVAAQFNGGYDAAKTGSAMSEGFGRSLPLDFLELWAVGEESGDLDKTSAKLAQIYMDKAQFRFEIVAQWMPKIVYFAVMIFMAIQIIKGFMTIYGGLANSIGNF